MLFGERKRFFEGRLCGNEVSIAQVSVPQQGERLHQLRGLILRLGSSRRDQRFACLYGFGPVLAVDLRPIFLLRGRLIDERRL